MTVDTRPDARLVPILTAAAMLGFSSRSFVYDLLARGELEAVKLGRRRLVVVESIDAYVNRLRGETQKKAEAGEGS